MALRIYIQTEMDFLDISSLDTAYRYVIKIEQKFKHQNKRKFGSANPQQKKYDKDVPNKQPPENQPKPQEKKGHGKVKKDTEKWRDFHKIPWHNIHECRSKQSLVAEIKDKESNLDLESDYENIDRRQIIDEDPTALVATTTIQPEEPTDPEEGEHLFHSQMWVKGTPLHLLLIVEARRTSSQQRSSNSWDCRQHHTRNHTTSGGFARDEIFVSTNSVDCRTTSNPSRMRYYVMFPHWMFEMFSWANHICGNAMLFMSLDSAVSFLLWGVISIEYQRYL
jgi:hypothetical protein